MEQTETQVLSQEKTQLPLNLDVEAGTLSMKAEVPFDDSTVRTETDFQAD